MAKLEIEAAFVPGEEVYYIVRIEFPKSDGGMVSVAVPVLGTVVGCVYRRINEEMLKEASPETKEQLTRDECIVRDAIGTEKRLRVLPMSAVHHQARSALVGAQEENNGKLA